MEMYEEIN